ncbi:hypothetical protein L596_000570 [Steinernema carpocapsae]|uniref:Uncharacterized protein n=1 Tax=Steinernema carpocapsae TaxID=34508 RepID=A0A4U8UJW0_STECR|nr:hypothetical protein L596_000570 [Steinernema carpocapsae]
MNYLRIIGFRVFIIEDDEERRTSCKSIIFHPALLQRTTFKREEWPLRRCYRIHEAFSHAALSDHENTSSWRCPIDNLDFPERGNRHWQKGSMEDFACSGLVDPNSDSYMFISGEDEDEFLRAPSHVVRVVCTGFLAE